MNRGLVLAIAAIVVGALIILLKVGADGLDPSFVLLLGALIVVDGVLRLLTLRRPER